MTEVALNIREVISFGPFSLVASERLLMKEGAPVELGGRTLDTLIALASRPQEVIGKRELMAQIWPDVIVEEGNLRSYIAALRNAIGDGIDGARYIATLPGRGYCFVAPVSRSAENIAPVAAPLPDTHFLPGRLVGMVGRSDDVSLLSAELAASRFVTIVGPGGVGKTTVALAVGHNLIEAFAGAVLFLDLGALSDPSLVTVSLASMLGITLQSDNPMSGLLAYLRDKRMLLILDNCEHLIEAAANLAALIFAAAPQLHILATSREALRAEGEHVYMLEPLAYPPAGLPVSAALDFPAIQLFVERAAAGGARFALNDANLAVVSDISSKLEGVPLVIQLVAGRVGTYGLEQTAALLDRRLALLWQGRRTAPPRQRSLQATLDWSYRLLSELERMVFRSLAVFVGSFEIEAALAVVASETNDQGLVFGAIDSLVTKSMVATRRVGATTCYQLLDTTRAYILKMNIDGTEFTDLATRHATYYRQWLEQDGAKWPTLSNASERARHLTNLGNVRAALEWCFGVDGNAEIGVGLASAASLVFWAMSLPAECLRWSERALLSLNDDMRGGREEMRLQAALGLSLMHTRGIDEVARAAMERGLAIAEQHGNSSDGLLPFGPLHMFHIYIGDCRTALYYARRGAAVAAAKKDPVDIALAHTIVGISMHYTGHLSGARLELEAAQDGAGAWQSRTDDLSIGHHILASITLARTLWVQGYPSQAVERVHRTIEEAASMELPALLTDALSTGIPVFLWAGDVQRAEEHNNWFYSSLAQSHSVRLNLPVARGYSGYLALCKGDVKGGIEYLRECLEELRAVRFELSIPPFIIPLAQALGAIGDFAQGAALIDETIQSAEAGGHLLHMPELLRVKGELLLAQPQPSDVDAEACFGRSLELSRGQGALSWELRTATSFADLRRKQGRIDDALGMLEPIFSRFVEGFDTADLMSAKHLLDELAWRQTSAARTKGSHVRSG